MVFSIEKADVEEISAFSIFEEISTFEEKVEKVEIFSKLAKGFNLGKNWQIS